ncbi:hypothetical protein PR048_012897 [Dryococelus australis]|uniref:DDE-1 domain-containing protein n=1 Tax=Dryococelus australis TaxID=614101 RepID=A0ABQ9HQY3_9NEOP|nr:hypothetical protein PR048_012897 [Dryococelus australis]
MDNHSLHITLEAINFCRDLHVVVVGFPAHTAHRLQPLAVSFFGPLKTAYSKAYKNVMVSQPGTITIKDVSSLFCSAYNKVASARVAVKGFRTTGIDPFNDNIFTDEDLEASKTTYKPQSTADLPVTSIRPTVGPEDTPVAATVGPDDTPVAATVGPDDTPVAATVAPENTPVAATVGPDNTPVAATVAPENTLVAATPTPPDKEETLHTPDLSEAISQPCCRYSLPALALVELKVKRKCRKLPSLVISSSPVKQVMEEIKATKEETTKKRNGRLGKQKQVGAKKPKISESKETDQPNERYRDH